jgi:sirohydrochlorin ferrochelatase
MAVFNSKLNDGMPSVRPAMVLVGHGSILAESGLAMMKTAELLRARLGNAWVKASFLNYSEPTFAATVAEVAAQGATHIIVQPYFLIRGYYVIEELPALVARVARDFPGVTFEIADVLGEHPALVSLAKLRLQAVDDYPSSSTGLLFVAHGTPIEEANQPVAAVLAGVQQQLGYGPASIGYLDCNQPAILDAFDQLAAAGVNRIAVLPYFLHLGRHVRRDLPALFAEAIARHPSLDIRIAHHLADDPLLVDVVATRIVAAQCAIARHVCAKAGITVRKELQ